MDRNPQGKKGGGEDEEKEDELCNNLHFIPIIYKTYLKTTMQYLHPCLYCGFKPDPLLNTLTELKNRTLFKVMHKNHSNATY